MWQAEITGHRCLSADKTIEKAIADVKAVALLIKKFLQGNGFSYASRIFINSSPEMVSFS